MKSQPLRSLFLAAMTALLWLLQLHSSPAVTYPTQWQLLPAQDADGRWWGALHVQTVPGVRYHLQRSTTLMGGSWTNIDSMYGMGEEWVCPVLPANAPPVGTLPQEVIALPPYPAQPLKQVSLALGRTANGEVAIHFISPDDGSMKQKVFSGLTLDPAWDEFDNSYFNAHGNFWLGISPQLQSPMTESPLPSAFGPQDEAVIAVFAASLGEMTANIINSIESAKHYSRPPDNAEAKAFYRISADWGVDSNGGGRMDWEQLVLDGTDPFSPAPEGGDAAPAPDGGSPDGYPVPSDAQPPTPRAHIQQRTIYANHGHVIEKDGEQFNSSDGAVYYSNDGDKHVIAESVKIFEETNNLGALNSELNKIPFPDDAWCDELREIFSKQWDVKEDPPSSYNFSECASAKAEFRLKLDGPAPEGGYQIPMRFLKHYLGDDDYGGFEFIDGPSGESAFFDTVLEVAEGQSEGTPVAISVSGNVGKNQWLFNTPGNVTLADVINEPTPADGICVGVGDYFTARFCEKSAFRSFAFIDAPITWQKRQLNGAGTFGGWTSLESWEDHPSAQGFDLYATSSQPGVFQVRALVRLPNGREVEFPCFRRKNARSIVDSRNQANALLKAGRPDCFGVCKNGSSLALRKEAVKWLGSKAYSKRAQVKIDPGSVFNPNLGAPAGNPEGGASKCNIFVAHIADHVGLRVPLYYRVPGAKDKFFNSISNSTANALHLPLIPSAPMAKEDWYKDPEDHIDLDNSGWIFLAASESPSPGMVIASPQAGGDATGHGHMGVLDYDGSWINAGKLNINKSVNIADPSEDYKPTNLRAR